MDFIISQPNYANHPQLPARKWEKHYRSGINKKVQRSVLEKNPNDYYRRELATAASDKKLTISPPQN
ncbi:hypothetical protein ABIE10_000262 [Citrobacter sp. 506]|uniref:hypothetical protein n=1 Tax=Citrobacter sp. 506 TaxID=3156447 RepID=UPI003D21637F